MPIFIIVGYVWRIKEGGGGKKAPSYLWAALKKPILNRVNPNGCKNLSVDEIDALSDTAKIFFHFIQALGNKLKLRNFVNIWTV